MVLAFSFDWLPPFPSGRGTQSLHMPALIY